MNIFATILIPIYAVCILTTVRFEEMYALAAILSTVVCCLLIPMSVFGSLYDTLLEYGCSFVIYRKNKHGAGGYHSTFANYLYCVLVVVACVVNWILIFNNK